MTDEEAFKSTEPQALTEVDIQATVDDSTLPPGHSVFEYRIDKVLGGGGFGITYLAQDVNLQLPVAIKEYFPTHLAVRGTDRTVQVRTGDVSTQFQTGLERFIEEARALASFRHPNIVRVLRYFKNNGSAYIVMEYESGHSLKRWMERQPALTPKALLKVIYPLMEGLEAVHRLNFLHRDIKPDNIYIRADGTPVLLDFGAARRVVESQDMTNIVSPGYAPFEQYHSQGNQGPWTDVYSLGAVMYWMTTGQKPTEAAARVRRDAMPKAAHSANAATFGAPLMQAIDWALMPDETQRPQTVTAFRKALRALDPSDAGDDEEVMRKNVMGSIMFVDLVAYSTHSLDQQVLVKAQFNELLAQVLSQVKESSRIMVDTGDGAAICFLGDPEDALMSVLRLRALLELEIPPMFLRMGLHLGPLRKVMDINNRVNVVGDGINVAQRIMDFSMPNQIVVSRSYFDVISRISDSAANLFDFLGARLDKHHRSHELYAVINGGLTPPAIGDDQQVGGGAFWADNSQPLTPDMVADIEAELAQAIGPLAHVLVKKAITRTNSSRGLREFLSVSIQDDATREAFLRPKIEGQGGHSSAFGRSFSRPSGVSQNHKSTTGTSRSAGYSGTPLGLPSASLPSSSVRSVGASKSGSISRNVEAFSRHMPMSGPSAYQVDASHPSASQSKPVMPVMSLTMGAEQQVLLERALGEYIGPLAKTLVRKEAARHTTVHDLLQALALHIDAQAERAKFLTATRKLRP
jgi:serine/threonine protein kinase